MGRSSQPGSCEWGSCRSFRGRHVPAPGEATRTSRGRQNRARLQGTSQQMFGAVALQRLIRPRLCCRFVRVPMRKEDTVLVLAPATRIEQQLVEQTQVYPPPAPALWTPPTLSAQQPGGPDTGAEELGWNLPSPLHNRPHALVQNTWELDLWINCLIHLCACAYSKEATVNHKAIETLAGSG